jgi:hypothetical protein
MMLAAAGDGAHRRHVRLPCATNFVPRSRLIWISVGVAIGRPAYQPNVPVSTLGAWGKSPKHKIHIARYEFRAVAAN